MDRRFRQIKIRMANLLTRPVFGRFLAVVFGDRIPAEYGLVVDTGNPKITAGTKASLFWGIYEGAEMRFVDRYLPRHQHVVELGGSIGVISSLIRRKLDGTAALTVVEADKDLIPAIRSNVATNAPDRPLEVIHGAVAYTDVGQDGCVTFFSGEQNTGGSKYARGAAEGHAGELSVPAVQLADILESRNIDRFSLVSDIEGAEAELLEHDDGALGKCDFMIIELHEVAGSKDCASIKELLDKLISRGFRLVDSDGAAVYVLARS